MHHRQLGTVLSAEMFGYLQSGSRLSYLNCGFPSLYIYNEVSELVFEMLEGSGRFCVLSSVFLEDPWP